MKTLQKVAAPFVICGFVLLFATGNIEVRNTRMLGVFFCLAVELIAFGIVFLATSMFVQPRIATATILPSTPPYRRIENFYLTFEKKKRKKSKAPAQVQPKRERVPFDDKGWREAYELTEHYKQNQ